MSWCPNWFSKQNREDKVITETQVKQPQNLNPSKITPYMDRLIPNPKEPQNEPDINTTTMKSPPQKTRRLVVKFKNQANGDEL